jgi:hypothetical protein
MNNNSGRTGVIVATLMCAAFAIVDADDAETANQAFRVESPQLDIGKVRAGAEAVATFVFHNDGEKDVRIIRAKPS